MKSVSVLQMTMVRSWPSRALILLLTLFHCIEGLLSKKLGVTVGYCGTRGHHHNPFTPDVDTYYLKSDQVGGSSDCAIAHVELQTALHKSTKPPSANDLLMWLSERLNARESAPWEGSTETLFLSLL